MCRGEETQVEGGKLLTCKGVVRLGLEARGHGPREAGLVEVPGVECLPFALLGLVLGVELVREMPAFSNFVQVDDHASVAMGLVANPLAIHLVEQKGEVADWAPSPLVPCLRVSLLSRP